MKCTCPIEPNMDYDALKGIITNKYMCTEGAMYICPNLDSALIKARAERDRKEAYTKRQNARKRQTVS